MSESDIQQPLSSSNGELSPSGPLDVDQDVTLERIERSMPVRLIATFDNLITATPIHNWEPSDYSARLQPPKQQYMTILSIQMVRVEEEASQLGKRPNI